jgi:hypothetical protein
MKDNFNIHEWNLKRYLLNEQQDNTFNLSNLTFDQIIPLFPKQIAQNGIAFPEGGGVSRRIKHEDSFENWKKDTMDKYGDVKIQLNPNAVWYDNIKILDDEFIDDEEKSIQSKSDFYDKLKYKGD